MIWYTFLDSGKFRHVQLYLAEYSGISYILLLFCRLYIVHTHTHPHVRSVWYVTAENTGMSKPQTIAIASDKYLVTRSSIQRISALCVDSLIEIQWNIKIFSIWSNLQSNLNFPLK